MDEKRYNFGNGKLSRDECKRSTEFSQISGMSFYFDDLSYPFPHMIVKIFTRGPLYYLVSILPIVSHRFEK